MLFERGIDPEDEKRGPGRRRRLALAHRDPQLRRRRGPRGARGDRRGRHRRREPSPVLAGGLAAYTVLEHEPMHHETLSYILHRLPYDQKIRPAGLPAPLLGGEPPARRSVRVAAGRATLGVEPRGDPLRLGQRVSEAAKSTSPLSTSTSTAYQPRLPGVRRSRWLRRRSAVGRGGLGLARPSTTSGTRSSGSSIAACGCGAGCGTSCRCRWPGPPTSRTPRRRPTRGGRAGACRPRRSITARRTARRAAASARSPGATRRPTRPAATSTSRARIRCRWRSFPRGASAWGVRDLVGNGWEWTSTVFAPFPGFEPMPSYPQYSADFFDGQALRHEGRLAGDAEGARAPQLPQLVPPELSLRLREVPDGRRHDSRQRPGAAGRGGPRLRRGRAARPRARAEADPVASTSTTDSARPSSRRSAGCRGTGSRAPRAACSRGSPPTMVEPLEDPITFVELGCGSGEKLAMLAESLPQPAQARARPPDRHLARRPRALRAHPRRASSTSRSSATARRTRRACATRRRSGPARGTMLVLFLGSNIGNFDRPAADEFLAGIRRALRPGDALLLGADLVKPESELLLAYDDPLGVTAAFNKNLLARMNTELLARLRPRRRSPTAPSGTRSSAGSRCTSSRSPTRPCGSRARATRSPSRAGESIWTESSYKYDADEVVAHGRRRGLPPATSSGSSPTRGSR